LGLGVELDDVHHEGTQLLVLDGVINAVLNDDRVVEEMLNSCHFVLRVGFVQKLSWARAEVHRFTALDAGPFSGGYFHSFNVNIGLGGSSRLAHRLRNLILRSFTSEFTSLFILGLDGIFSFLLILAGLSGGRSLDHHTAQVDFEHVVFSFGTKSVTIGSDVCL